VHPVTRRLAGGALVATTILASTVAAWTAPASAGDGGTGTRGPIDHSGNPTGSGYTAAAAMLTADGPGSSGGDTDNTCEVPGRPGEPAHIGRLYSGPGADGTYLVIIYCDIDAPFEVIDTTATITYFAGFVTPLDPEALVERALADLNLERPDIITNPGGGLNSLTGLATYLRIDPETLIPPPVTDVAGPVSVVITAQPSGDGHIVWDTGEGQVTCANYGNPEGSCSYVYQRSSLDQPGNQYGITASVTYTGSYAVYVDGDFYGGDANIGNVELETEPYLLGVAEAQAINTNP
jgi:hypothetical protein